MAHTFNIDNETQKPEKKQNVHLNTKQSSTKPPKIQERELLSQAVKPSKEEKKLKKRKRGQSEPGLESNGPPDGELVPIVLEGLEDGKRKKSKKLKKLKKSKHVEPQEEAPVDPDEEARMKKYEAIFSKYQKSARLAEAEKKSAPLNEQQDLALPAEASELHDLTPIPQPPPAPEPEYKPSFSALPSWLAKPVVVESNVTASFAEFSLDSKLQENLKRKGYEKSLAVQAAVIPLLLPGPKAYMGDVCISAATGSGKTLAYILPMVERLKQKITTRLRGLVVVPTRELVAQVREVAEVCAAGTGLQIGVAIGNVSLAEEQDRLIKKGQRYDPIAREKMYNDAKARYGVDFSEDVQLQEDFVKLLPDHVPEFSSKVDLLICTPGRLVDHIRNTKGFSIKDVEWLVIDEADRLLDENFQEWVTTLLNALHSKKLEDQMIARQRVLGVASSEERRVRKVILSATMTRDLSKLASLRLKRPILVAIVDHNDHDTKSLAESRGGMLETNAENFELPSTLAEAAIPVGDGSEKPLYLLHLLHNKLLPSKVLIFTSNNENAGRLGHLLPMMDLSLDGNVGVLTKASSSSKASRKTLKAFQSGKLSILIASDRASRGLDVPDIAHVVNYDMPHGLTSYVHRVGRTARAGREGMAWTLFTSTEARWFWNEIARSSRISRGSRKVERTKLDIDSISQETRSLYEKALKKLQSAVLGGK